MAESMQMKIGAEPTKNEGKEHEKAFRTEKKNDRMGSFPKCAGKEREKDFCTKKKK